LGRKGVMVTRRFIRLINPPPEDFRCGIEGFGAAEVVVLEVSLTLADGTDVR